VVELHETAALHVTQHGGESLRSLKALRGVRVAPDRVEELGARADTVMSGKFPPDELMERADAPAVDPV
jgi:hypothetical protein